MFNRLPHMLKLISYSPRHYIPMLVAVEWMIFKARCLELVLRAKLFVITKYQGKK